MMRRLPFQVVLVVLAFLLIILISYLNSSIRTFAEKDVNKLKKLVVQQEPQSSVVPEGITLILLGDIMLGRTVEIKSSEVGDFTYPFKKTADKLKAADITFANLENPIIEDCPRHEVGFKFCATPKMLDGLVYSGMDIVSLANNHSGNYGEGGIKETERYLESAGIRYVEQGSLAVVEAKGVKFGFLGFDYVFKKPKEKDYQLVIDSKAKVDILIISPHWGTEYTSEPTNEQREWAKRFVDSGADIIVGHHPHWVQTVEYINGRPVYYSLGNFIFDQMWSEKTKKGMLVKLDFENGVIINEGKTHVYMRRTGQPEIVKNE
jgi:poly-gamma-glutamate capsule biosynthesis protein CapA/YwtB (metallophosphatase superfamily)